MVEKTQQTTFIQNKIILPYIHLNYFSGTEIFDDDMNYELQVFHITQSSIDTS